MIPAIYRSAAVALVVAAAPLLLAAAPAAAQRSVSMKAETDSTARIVPRVPLSYADASLRTRDRQVALLLTDTDLVLQLTDRGLSGVRSDIRRGDGEQEGLGSRILAHVLSAGVGEFLNHGIAAPLSTLRRARVDGSRLVIENRDGEDLFAEVEVNGKQPMEEFSPDEARRFADAVNRAIRQHRAVASGPRR
ncbi:MAG TPA: hypothetical protein VFS20_05200 [Longimicrobium sp.]|nr:hypothetical protein [Longimicrobium sp.]